MARLLICVVDDDLTYRTITKRLLKEIHQSPDALFFEDGEQAFEYISEHHNEVDKLPDYIFLDLNMPYMDGWDFLDEYVKIIPKLAKTITIYIVTSSILESDRQKAAKYTQVSDFLVKPIKKEQFAGIIEDAYKKLI